MKETSPRTDLISEKDLFSVTSQIFKYDFVSGLPCGELRHFISESESNKEITHLKATNEREAVGIAQGAWIAGKKPVLYMQNSGLFESSNEIASLLIPCKSPVLFVVSWRGSIGETATQHLYTGASTIPLLESLGLPYVEDITENNLRVLRQKMENLSLPGIILVKRENFNDFNTLDIADTPMICKPSGIINNELHNKLEISREDALDTIFNLIDPNDAVISSTGLISRSIFQNHDGNNQFYNAGAFGLTNMIALGFAVNNQGTRTFAIEGDGSVLTNLGSLNVIGHHAPDNFLHIVLDNAAYVSCSGEKTFGSSAIPLIARDCGYKNIHTVQTSNGIKNAMYESKTGPSMIHVQINTIGERNFRRPLEMDKVAVRFREKFSKI